MKADRNNSIRLFLKYAGRYRKAILFLTFIYIAATVLLVLAPQALSLFIDTVHSGNLLHAAALAILLYLAAMFAQSVMAAVLDYRLASVGQRITDDYRMDLMAHFLSLDAQRLASVTSGEMLTRLNEDAQGLFSYYYIFFYKLTGSALALAGILVILFLKINWLSAALLLFSILAILFFKAIQDRGVPKYVRRAAANALFNSLQKEILDNSPLLRGLHAEEYAEIRLHSEMKKRYRESFPANLMYANLWSASTVVEVLLVGAGLLLGLLLRDRSSISLGTAYMIYTYCTLVSSPLQDFRNHMGNMQSAKAGIVRTGDFMNLASGVSCGDRILSAETPGNFLDTSCNNTRNTARSIAIDLEIRDLCFSYGDSPPVLNGINLKIPAGGHLGVMGETGCGKSTLLSLIAGFNSFDKGDVLLDGVSLRETDPLYLRRNVAYCTQKVQLIHGSIRDNITFYDESYSDADILKAIGLLDLNGWFSKFPDGLETHLEMGEGNLSSGEAQLLALVRLSLKSPGLVLLDEITSSLDAAAERRITAAVKKMCEGRTVIAIAHRREALDWMDTVLRMENGALIPQTETGSPQSGIQSGDGKNEKQ